MAGSKPGPARGHGGRPRVKNPAVNGEGYQQVTTGPAGRGTRQYKHRVVAGAKRGQVVDHKNAKRNDNSRGNLRLTTRGNNTAMSNRKRAR